MKDIYIKNARVIEQTTGRKHYWIRKVFADNTVLRECFYDRDRTMVKEQHFELPSGRIVNILFDNQGNRIRIINAVDVNSFSKQF